MYTVKISATGGIVIPEPLREKYGLIGEGRVLVVDRGGILELLPLPDDPVEALHGMLEGDPPLAEALLAERAREQLPEEGGCG